MIHGMIYYLVWEGAMYWMNSAQNNMAVNTDWFFELSASYRSVPQHQVFENTSDALIRTINLHSGLASIKIQRDFIAWASSLEWDPKARGKSHLSPRYSIPFPLPLTWISPLYPQSHKPNLRFSFFNRSPSVANLFPSINNLCPSLSNSSPSLFNLSPSSKISSHSACEGILRSMFRLSSYVWFVWNGCLGF